jgi:hypothetical protein
MSEESIKTYSSATRIKEFLKQKLPLIVLSIGCFAFVFKDVVNWKLNSDNIHTLIISMIITYFFTMYVVIIMGKMGIKAGKNNQIFLATLDYYTKAKKEIEPYRQYLGKFCKMKTQEEQLIMQKHILDEENLEVDKLYEYDLTKMTKRQIKCIQKAKKLKTIRLQERDLVSERGWSKKSQWGTYLGKSEREFVIANETSNSLSKFLLPIAITLLGIESIVMANIVGGLIKVAVVLFSGLINYLSNEDFALNELRNRFINKADFLKEFKALCEQGYFDEPVKVEKEIFESSSV